MVVGLPQVQRTKEEQGASATKEPETVELLVWRTSNTNVRYRMIWRSLYTITVPRDIKGRILCNPCIWVLSVGMRDQIRAYCINENSNTFSLMQYALIVSDGRLSYGNRDFLRPTAPPIITSYLTPIANIKPFLLLLSPKLKKPKNTPSK